MMKIGNLTRALLIGSLVVCVVGCVLLSLSRGDTSGCTCNQLPLDSTTCSTRINQCPMCTYARLGILCSSLKGLREPLGALIHKVNTTGTQGPPYNHRVNCWDFQPCEGTQYTNECVPAGCQGDPDKLCDECLLGTKTIKKEDSFHCTTCTEL